MKSSLLKPSGHLPDDHAVPCTAPGSMPMAVSCVIAISSLKNVYAFFIHFPRQVHQLHRVPSLLHLVNPSCRGRTEIIGLLKQRRHLQRPWLRSSMTPLLRFPYHHGNVRVYDLRNAPRPCTPIPRCSIRFRGPIRGRGSAGLGPPTIRRRRRRHINRKSPCLCVSQGSEDSFLLSRDDVQRGVDQAYAIMLELSIFLTSTLKFSKSVRMYLQEEPFY